MQLRSPPEHELEVGFGGRWRPASERQRKKICCCGCERRTDRDPLLQREVSVRSLANIEELVVRGQRDGMTDRQNQYDTEGPHCSGGRRKSQSGRQEHAGDAMPLSGG